MNKDYSSSMTVLSRAAYQSATSVSLSPRAAAALLDKVEIRTFRDILCTCAPEETLRPVLVDGLCANDPARSRDSVDKKVRGWLSGRYQPTKREDLLELCFVLGLNAESASAFLCMAGDEGLHWRDPREIVYGFALERGMNYPQAVQLHKRALSAASPIEAETQSFTPLIRQEVQQCATEEELLRYLCQSSAKLGSLHNSAYRQLTAMLQVLESPASLNGTGEKRYTTREVVEKYLDRHLPSLRESKALDEKKRSILADWPDEIALSRMKNRKLDVSRKVLILLFLATDGGEEPEEDWYDEEEDADASFRSSCLRMNRMLSECGYGMLDPRNPFDWLALYCMRVEEDSVSMDGLNERLSHVLEVLFRPEQED